MPTFRLDQVQPARPAGKTFRVDEVSAVKAPERETIEINGTLYSGAPEHIAAWESGTKKTPEEAGLSLAERARTWRDTAKDIVQGAGRVAGQGLGGAGGLVVGGFPGMIAGSSAAGALTEAAIKGGEQLAGEDESGNAGLIEAAKSGAKEGAVTGAMGAAGGVLGRVGGKVVGSIAPRLGKVGVVGGELAGETAGMAGVSAASDLAQGKPAGAHNLEDAALYTLAGRTIGAAGKKVLGLKGRPEAAPDSLKGKAASSLKAPLKRIMRQEAVDQADLAQKTSLQELRKEKTSTGRLDLKEDLRTARGLEDEANVGLEAAAGKQGDAQAVLKKARLEQEEAKGAMGGLAENERLAGAELSKARAERKAAQVEHQAGLQARTQNAPRTAEEAIASGRRRVREVTGVNETVTLKRRKGVSEKTTATAELGIASEIARPDYGFLAKELEDAPEIAHLLRKHFGEEFVPSKAEIGWVGDELNPVAVKRGSYAMKQREKRLQQLIREKGPEWAQKAGKGYAEDISAFMLGHPEYGKGLTADELKNLRTAAAGRGDKKTIDEVMRTVTKRISGRSISPRLFAANRAFDQAQLRAWEAQARTRGSGEANWLAETKRQVLSRKVEAGKVGEEYATARKARSAATLSRRKAKAALANSPEETAVSRAREAHDRNLERLSGAKARLKQVEVSNPQMTTWFGRPKSLRTIVSAAAGVGGLAGGNPLVSLPFGAYVALNTKTGAKFLHGLGDIIAKGVPPAVGAYLRPVHEAVKRGNLDVAKATLAMAAQKSEDVKAWLEQHLGGE